MGAIPEHSIQNPILLFAPHDLVGVATRLRPFMGQIGTTPAVDLPDSHNAGDFGAFLLGAPHRHAVTPEQLESRTDGHLDIDSVRAGAILIAPVKVAGAGIYLGDMHAMQGDGEIAGHTCDVSGTVTLQVHVLKGLAIDGPILLPVAEDLPFLARPLSAAERRRAAEIARRNGVAEIEESLPISVIGTGPDLSSAVENGLQRSAALLGMSVPEVKNRATITGAIEIGRSPGVIQVTFLAPVAALARLGIADARAHALRHGGLTLSRPRPAQHVQLLAVDHRAAAADEAALGHDGEAAQRRRIEPGLAAKLGDQVVDRGAGRERDAAARPQPLRQRAGEAHVHAHDGHRLTARTTTPGRARAGRAPP